MIQPSQFIPYKKPLTLKLIIYKINIIRLKIFCRRVIYFENIFYQIAETLLISQKI